MSEVKELPKRYWEISAFNNSLYAEDLITALACAAQIEMHGTTKPEVWQCERESKTITGKSRVDLTQRAYRELVEVFKNLNEIANEVKAWNGLDGLLTSSIVENINIEPPKEETPKEEFVHPYVQELSEKLKYVLDKKALEHSEALATMWTAKEFIEEESLWHDRDIASLFYEHPQIGEVAKEILCKRYKISNAEFSSEELDGLFEIVYDKTDEEAYGDYEKATYPIYKCVADAVYNTLTDDGLAEVIDEMVNNFVETLCEVLCDEYSIISEEFEIDEKYEIIATKEEFFEAAREIVKDELGDAGGYAFLF